MISKLYVLVLPLLALTYPLENNIIIARCVEVIDGDTIKVQRGDRKFKVRLGFIDAPELDQRSLEEENPIGIQSKYFLESLILNKKIKIKHYGKGRYGRLIGEIFYNHENINLKLIEKGHAILYKYSSYPSNKHRAEYHSTAHIAMNKRLGLWAEVGFMNPSYYRKYKRMHKKSPWQSMGLIIRKNYLLISHFKTSIHT